MSTQTKQHPKERTPIPKVLGTSQKILLAVGGLALLGLLGLVTADVISRNAFNLPIQGSLEISLYWLMVPAVFVGIWWAEVVRDHVTVSVLNSRLGPSSAKLAAGLVALITVVFAMLLAWVGLQEALDRTAQGEYAGAYRTPIWPMRYVVVVGMIAYAVVVIGRTIAVIQGKSNTHSESQPEAMEIL